jgi:proteic killer suppression protein
MLDNAVEIIDLRPPSTNRFQILHGGRECQHSIRISDKWRLSFVWTELGPEALEIVDYQ